jgi:cellobiose transport system permease protein
VKSRTLGHKSGVPGALSAPVAALLLAVLVSPLVLTLANLTDRGSLGLLWRLTNDLAMWVAVGNSVGYAIFGGLAVTVFSVVAAWALQRAFGFHAERAASVLVLPAVFGPVVSGYAASGLIAWAGETTWLADPVAARLLILSINVWLGLGMGTLLTLGALRQLDMHTVEAVRMDGGGVRAVLWHVVRPALGPTLGTVFLLTAIAGLQVFELPLLLFQGPGPGGAGLTLTMYLYGLAFGQGNFGTAAWVAVAQGVVVLILSGSLLSNGQNSGGSE